MSPEQREQVPLIFARAAELSGPARLTYIREACAGESEMFDQVLRLLEAHDVALPHPPSSTGIETARSNRIGRYVLSGVLGRGSMGTVYTATDPRIGRKIAIKTINVEAVSASGGGFMRDRMLREARSAGILSHPGIVTIYDVDAADGVPYITMELVDGKSLQDLLIGGARFTIPQIVDILRQSAAALDYAHSHQIVHRDIKPGNIMLQQNGVVKITDFGIAKIKSADVANTQTNLIMGTPAYMSPEQISGTPIDGRSDQHALGVLAYQLFTGELPFKAETIHGLAIAIATGARPLMSAVNPALPRALDAPVQRSLATNAEDRFPTCMAFVEALDHAQRPPQTSTSAAAPVNAGPPPHYGPAQTREWQPPATAEPAVPEPRPRVASRMPLLAGGIVAALALTGGGIFYYRNHSTPPGTTQSGSPSVVAPAAVLPPAIVRFTAQPASARPGDPVTLAWQVADAARVVIDQGVGKVDPSGSIEVHPSTRTAYTLTASGAGQEKSASVVVEMSEAKAPPLKTKVPEPAPVVHEKPKPDARALYAEAIENRQSDPARVAALLKQAADLGEPRAMLELGRMHLNGEGVAQNAEQAAQWFRKAAEAGSPPAMARLGQMYAEGKGVPKDEQQAISWLRRGADAGAPTAMFHLGRMYEQGTGVPRDQAEAKRLYQQAALQGNPEARARLAQVESGVAVTAIQPPFLAAGQKMQYKLLGSGLSLKSTVSLSGPGFVGSRRDRQDSRPAEAASDGSWIRIFIEVDPSAAAGAIRITARSPGSGEAVLDVPVRR